MSKSIKRVEMLREMTRRSTSNLQMQGANFIPTVFGKDMNLIRNSLNTPHFVWFVL